jgi:hypothetical protein
VTVLLVLVAFRRQADIGPAGTRTEREALGGRSDRVGRGRGGWKGDKGSLRGTDLDDPQRVLSELADHAHDPLDGLHDEAAGVACEGMRAQEEEEGEEEGEVDVLVEDPLPVGVANVESGRRVGDGRWRPLQAPAQLHALVA